MSSPLRRTKENNRYFIEVNGHYFGLMRDPAGKIMCYPKWNEYHVLIKDKYTYFKNFRQAAEFLINNTIGDFYMAVNKNN